ncbi:MAG: response regulator, partial [Syntrophothermus sp.]
MKILVVEDNVSSKILLLKILKKEKYEVDSASNGIEALEILNKQKFDVILTDWMMPKMDGIELTARIRRDIKPVPAIIFVTALNSKEARNKALEAGADEYISKPYHILDIRPRIESAVMRQRSLQSADPLENKKERIRTPDFSGICIAASTGGPSTLIDFFSQLRPTRNSAIFIVLHGPAWM